jgi:transglutaminase-like putative cysteine protease
MIERFLSRLLKKFIRRVGPVTLVSLLLLATAMGSVILGLAGVIRGFDLWLMVQLAAIGLLLGWLLARAPLPGWLAGIVIVSLGLETLILRIGQLGDQLITLGQTLISLGLQTWRWPLDGPPHVQPALQAATELWLKLTILLNRFFNWIMAVPAGEPVYDPVATTLVWGLVLWLIAAWSSWVVRRHRQPLLALTPAGALLVLTFAFSPKHSGALVPVLGATLLLIALIDYETRENRWERTGLDYPLDVRLEMWMAVVPLVLALMLLAWMTPTLSLRQITRYVQGLIGGPAAQANPVASSFGVELSPRPASALERVKVGGLPRRHLIGSGPDLSERVVLVIHTNDPPLAAPETPPRYYWRSLTYDRYTGRGWITGNTQVIEYEAGATTAVEDAIIDPRFGNASYRGRILEQEVRADDSIGGLVYAAGELVTANTTFSIAWRGPGDIFGATLDAGGYIVHSRLPVFTETDLQATGTGYAQAMRRRYLAVPEDVPNRVLTLARDLTATAATPYDRAKAIESYLRAFPYTLDLPPPPPNRDIVDYFLFDLQQGYCDYYASAMVVLARAAGLPARLAVGYVNGTYDPEQQRYIVTEAEAHSWVEIYFPGYGWINFEPTGGRPAIDRSAKPPPVVPLELAQSPDSLDAPPAGINVNPLWWLVLPGSLALLVVTAAGWSVVDGWRLRRLTPAETIRVLYRRLDRQARRLNTPARAGDTPYEFATTLAGYVANLIRDRRWDALLRPAPRELHWLTERYVQIQYSSHHPVRADQVRAIRTWQRLRQRLWLAWLFVVSRR